MRGLIQDILCKQCGKPCGRRYPDRWSMFDGGEPGFDEGIGENFAVGDSWHCSQKCADRTQLEIQDMLDQEDV